MTKIEKLLERAGTHLEPGEQPLAAIKGTYETQPARSEPPRSGVLMATHTRIVFYARKLGGYDLESFPYGEVTSFEQSKSVLGHAVSFLVSGSKITVKWIGDAAALQQFAAAVRERIARHASGTGWREPRSSARADGDDRTSIIEAIRHLGDLRQAGVLTEAEFEAKKADLLDRL